MANLKILLSNINFIKKTGTVKQNEQLGSSANLVFDYGARGKSNFEQNSYNLTKKYSTIDPKVLNGLGNHYAPVDLDAMHAKFEQQPREQLVITGTPMKDNFTERDLSEA